MADERHGFLTETRTEDEGVITCECGHTETYDLPATEYAIERERAKAQEKFIKHTKNEKPANGAPQHDFENKLGAAAE